MLSDRFRDAVEQGTVDEAAPLFAEEAMFRSPVLFKPYEGRDQVVKVLRAAERVLGAEGEGLRRLTRETCDVIAGLAMKGAMESLNVSAAAAVALYELTRR